MWYAKLNESGGNWNKCLQTMAQYPLWDLAFNYKDDTVHLWEQGYLGTGCPG